MTRLVSGDQDEQNLELQKLHSACKHWGLFQLVKHGVSSSLLEKLKHEVEEFYKLPLEAKMKYKMREEIPWSLYLSELQKIATKLLGLMAKALRISVKEMIELFDDGMQAVRMAYYPPCPKPELVMALTPHSDITLLTILHQLNGVDGLHVKKDGLWFPLNFNPDALIVNVGDILEIFSNGVYHSIEHKVAANAEKERISIAFSINPKFEADVGPSPSLINPNNPPLFRKVGMEQYLKDFFSRKLNGKTYLDHMRII
ncbi:hypothetical protein REPUB_Repub16aG0044900 [Reevesia pubescens]